MSIDEASDLTVQNEKAGELLIQATTSAGVALLKVQENPQSHMDRLNLTRTERSELLKGLVRRFPISGKLAVTKDTHSPELAAELLHNDSASGTYTGTGRSEIEETHEGVVA